MLSFMVLCDVLICLFHIWCFALQHNKSKMEALVVRVSLCAVSNSTCMLLYTQEGFNLLNPEQRDVYRTF